MTYVMGTERIASTSTEINMSGAHEGQPVDTTRSKYDASGNDSLHAVHRRSVHDAGGGNGATTVPVSDFGAASYYGADEKLRVYSRVGTSTSRETRTVFEEYRYDALGRRVLVRSQADNAASGSDSLARSHIERFVWNGDQLLYEIRQQGHHSASDAQMESDARGDTTASATYFGVVGYIHGGALDRPLALIRNGQTIIPHAGFRGEYDAGSKASGVAAPTDIDWPGNELQTYSEESMHASQGWAGSLIRDKRDESGLKYMRNRYYDGKSGRFTQEDPIGLAGGMNLYGFASGDPVNFSDPFGLCTPMPWCLMAVAGGGAIASDAVAFGPSLAAGAASMGPAVGPIGLGLVAGVLLTPAFPGDGVQLGYRTRGAIAAADATAVYSRSEGKQIRAAIQKATGVQATGPQYDCMSEHIHECKESGDGGSKNKKGDFTWDELVRMAKDLFGKPNP
ncbi:MAG: RHS repeat-associated core domain-containing protein [Gemmatimonadota bacterium]